MRTAGQSKRSRNTSGQSYGSSNWACVTRWVLRGRGAPCAARNALKAFLWTCRRLNVRPTRYLFISSVQRQRGYLLERLGPGYRLRRTFRISTSRFGTGQLSGSNCTPLGLHCIAEKIGGGQPIGTVFKSRRPVGLIWRGQPNAAIAHRVLWLDGLEPGFNRGGNVDSRERYIYIHGLADEPSLGQPNSRGCIHLSAADLIPLFDQVPVGTLVCIGQ